MLPPQPVCPNLEYRINSRTVACRPAHCVTTDLAGISGARVLLARHGAPFERYPAG
jgi:hypothetical protein